jgi:hypothetical protein
MGLLASIFAYLSAISAIIVFFVMAADALLYHPHHRAANPQPELITAAAKIDPRKLDKAAQPPQRTADVAGIPKSGALAEYRRRSDLSNTRFEDRRRRTLRREQQARYWELRRDRAAAPLALGYAEEPAPQFGDEPRR